jgi:hypothetical protein
MNEQENSVPEMNILFVWQRKHFPAVGIEIEQCFGHRGYLRFKRPYVEG